MTTGGAEAPFAAFALIKVGDDGKAGLHHGHEDQLGDALAGLDGEVGLAALLKEAGLVPSTSEAIRAANQGGVKIDGEKIDNVKDNAPP